MSFRSPSPSSKYTVSRKSTQAALKCAKTAFATPNHPRFMINHPHSITISPGFHQPSATFHHAPHDAAPNHARPTISRLAPLTQPVTAPPQKSLLRFAGYFARFAIIEVFKPEKRIVSPEIGHSIPRESLSGSNLRSCSTSLSAFDRSRELGWRFLQESPSSI